MQVAERVCRQLSGVGVNEVAIKSISIMIDVIRVRIHSKGTVTARIVVTNLPIR